MRRAQPFQRVGRIEAYTHATCRAYKLLRTDYRGVQACMLHFYRVRLFNVDKKVASQSTFPARRPLALPRAAPRVDRRGSSSPSFVSTRRSFP